MDTDFAKVQQLVSTWVLCAWGDKSTLNLLIGFDNQIGIGLKIFVPVLTKDVIVCGLTSSKDLRALSILDPICFLFARQKGRR